MEGENGLEGLLVRMYIFELPTGFYESSMGEEWFYMGKGFTNHFPI